MFLRVGLQILDGHNCPRRTLTEWMTCHLFHELVHACVKNKMERVWGMSTMRSAVTDCRGSERRVKVSAAGKKDLTSGIQERVLLEIFNRPPLPSPPGYSSSLLCCIFFFSPAPFQLPWWITFSSLISILSVHSLHHVFSILPVSPSTFAPLFLRPSFSHCTGNLTFFNPALNSSSSSSINDSLPLASSIKKKANLKKKNNKNKQAKKKKEFAFTDV